jgi:hypothetical protein
VKKIIAIVLLAAFIPTQLFAWGTKGHAIVADIAASRVTRVTSANIRLLLGGDSLASVASWADQVRKDRKESFGWHFVDIPKDAAGFSQERDCFRPQDKQPGAQTDHHNCVVDRITMFQKVLGDEKAPRNDRIEALKWIVHFVGDLHQPLHAIAEGRGGNDIKVSSFGSPKCGTYDCNLHRVWDDELVQHTGYSEEDYVQHLNKLIQIQHLESRAGGTPVGWADESHSQGRQIMERPPSAVDEAYYQAHIALVNERLALAGLRLAALLNETLGGIPTLELKQDLEKHASRI